MNIKAAGFFINLNHIALITSRLESEKGWRLGILVTEDRSQITEDR